MTLIEISIHLIECNRGHTLNGKGVGGGGFHRKICVLFIHENEKSLDDLTILEKFVYRAKRISCRAIERGAGSCVS